MKMIKAGQAQLTRLHPRKVLLFCVCGVVFVLLEQPACADNLPDPTRPPSEIEAPTPSGAAVPVPSALVLQSVLISPRHKVAIINGETVKLGGNYGTAKVVKISESGVVLDAAGSLQTLKLFPGVEKKIPQAEEVNAPIGKKLPRGKRNAVRNEE